MMMSSPVLLRRGGLLLLFAGLLAGGCSRRDTGIAVTSSHDPNDPRHYFTEFKDCVYRVSAHGDTHLVGQALAASRVTGSIHEYLYARLFWTPRPGRTFSDSSGTNAMITYLVVADDGLAAYRGTGFVYLKKPRGGKLTAKLERAALEPAGELGTPPLPLGQIELAGELVAYEDPSRAVALQREIQTRAGDAETIDVSAE